MSEERMRLFFERQLVGMAITSPEKGWLQVNDKLCHMLGYSRKELELMTWAELTYPDDLAPDVARFEQLLAGGISDYSMEKRFIRKDGTVIFTDLSVGCVRRADGNVDYVLALLEDITERKQAEDKMKRQAEFLQLLIDTMPYPVYYKDRQGRFLGCNRSFEQIYRISREQIIGKTAYEITTKDLADVYSRSDDELYAHPGTQIYEGYMQSSDGVRHNAIFHKATFEGQDGALAGLVGTAIDITERKRVEEALRESEATVRNKLKAILEPEGDIGTLNLADIIDYEALQTMMEDLYRLTKIGNAVLDLSGKVLVAVGWQDICTKFHRIHPDTLKKCLESDVILASGVPEGTFKAYRCKNNLWDMVTPRVVSGRHLGNIYIGQFFYEDEISDYEMFRSQACQYGFDETEYLAALDRVPRWSRETVDAAMSLYAKVAGMISSLSFSTVKLSRALSQKDVALRQLGESEEKFRRITENISDLVCEVDAHAKYQYVSPSYQWVLGYSPQDLIGDSVFDRVHPEDRARVIDIFMEGVRTAKDKTVEFRYQYADGNYVWLRSSGHSMFGALGEFFGAIINSIDITERKQAEAEIHRLNEDLEKRVIERTAQLETVNKELESFAYSISHDLRAPLRGIDGWSLALLEDCADRLDERGQKYLEFVRMETQRMGRLIDGLLELSRVTRTDMRHEQVDLSALARSIAARLQNEEPDRQVEFIIQPSVTASGDERMFEVMISNLLGNAWKFTGKHPSARIEFGRTEMKGQPIYFIRDDGAGFDMAHSGRLFGAFERLHQASEFPGTGIGLATVRRIVNRHRGHVWAEGEVEKGATFYFVLYESVL